LPSFLLAHRPHSVSCLQTVVLLFITLGQAWIKSPDLLMDLSTAYRWLRNLRLQIVTRLPAIRKTLLELAPEAFCFDAQSGTELSDRVLFKRFLDVGAQLCQAAVCLADDQTDSHMDIFSFLNFYLTRHTGHPLLIR
jgi:hypothetical protein